MPNADKYDSFFQSLDLTVNDGTKYFLKAKFTEWFVKKIDEGLQEGKELEDIKVKVGLTTLKPLHDIWVCDLSYYFTSRKDEVINQECMETCWYH